MFLVNGNTLSPLTSALLASITLCSMQSRNSPVRWKGSCRKAFVIALGLGCFFKLRPTVVIRAHHALAFGLDNLRGFFKGFARAASLGAIASATA